MRGGTRRCKWGPWWVDTSEQKERLSGQQGALAVGRQPAGQQEDPARRPGPEGHFCSDLPPGTQGCGLVCTAAPQRPLPRPSLPLLSTTASIPRELLTNVLRAQLHLRVCSLGARLGA